MSVTQISKPISPALLRRQITALGVADKPTPEIVQTFRQKGKGKKISPAEIDRALGREPRRESKHYVANTDVHRLSDHQAKMLAAVKRHLIENPELWLIDVTNAQLLSVIGYAYKEATAIERVVKALRETMEARGMGPKLPPV